MKLTTATINVEYKVFSTETHTFKINNEALNNLLMKNKYKDIIAKKLAKGLKPIIDNPTGQNWQESYNLIYEALVALDR